MEQTLVPFQRVKEPFLVLLYKSYAQLRKIFYSISEFASVPNVTKHRQKWKGIVWRKYIFALARHKFLSYLFH